MPADSRRVKELFVAALELTEEAALQVSLDREVRRRCGTAQRVEALLHANDQPQPAPISRSPPLRRRNPPPLPRNRPK